MYVCKSVCMYVCTYVCMYGDGSWGWVSGGGYDWGGVAGRRLGPYIYIFIFIFESIYPIWKFNAFTSLLHLVGGKRLCKSVRTASNWKFRRWDLEY